MTLSNLENDDVGADFKPVIEEMMQNPPGNNKSPDLPTPTMFLDCKKEPEPTATTLSPSLSIPLLPSTAGDKNRSEEIIDADYFMAVGQVSTSGP